MTVLTIPRSLAASCAERPERAAWLERLPDTVRDLAARWRLTLGELFDGDEGSCSWVAQARRESGEAVVFKLGMPHMEGQHEIQGLRFWNGDPTVRLLDADDSIGAMLLERCVPGTTLRALPELEQDTVIAAQLQRLWRPPVEPHAFRPLSAMINHWSAATRADSSRWPDAGLVEEGLRLFDALLQSASAMVLLATDLHAGNVLRAEREPWLVIDPKPFVGDPAYDATQHLLNCRNRLRSDPIATIKRFSDLLGVDHERVRKWAVARLAAEPRDKWDDERLALARALAI